MKTANNADPVDPMIADAFGVLIDVGRRIRAVAAATPIGFSAEVDRLTEQWCSGEPRSWAEDVPRFRYSPVRSHADERRALDQILAVGSRADVKSENSLEIQVILDRAAELSHEAALAESVGQPLFRAVARARYGARDAFDRDADRLAPEWAKGVWGGGAERDRSPEWAKGVWGGGAERDRSPKRRKAPVRESDSPAGDSALHLSHDPRDPESLLSRTSAAVGAAKVPFRVRPTPHLAALAATADQTIWIAEGRWLTAEDAARTALHEVEGHAKPLFQSAREQHPIFRAGTRFGADDQEGRALWIEEQRGYLRAARRQELAFRHMASRAAHEGACFVDIMRLLREAAGNAEDRGTTARAIRASCRALRGGGLGREAVYLPAYLRFSAAAATNGERLSILRRGKVSIDLALQAASQSSIFSA